MTTPWLDRLLQLVSPPPGCGGVELDWQPTEEALGRALPTDFKRLVGTYGDVSFGGLFAPCYPSDEPHIDLLSNTREYRQILTDCEFLEPPEVLPPGVRIEAGDLIKWGGNDRGDHFLWHVGSDDPDQWSVILTDNEQGQWSFHHMTVPEFILRWFTKDLAPPELAQDWDRDEYLDGAIPTCDFYSPAADGHTYLAGIVVINALADSAVLPDGTRLGAHRDPYPESPGGTTSTEGVPRGSLATWPPPPGFPPPTILPLPPADLGKPVLDPADYPGRKKFEVLTDVPQSGSPHLDALVQNILPIAGREPFDWTATERALGRALPAEFTILGDLYGDVFFGKMLRPYHPSNFPYVDLVTRTAEFHQSVSRFPAGEWPADTIMAQLNLTPENTILWGGADNGDLHLWHLTGESPEEWTILLIGAYFHDWYSFTGSVPELIYRWWFDDLPDLPEYWSKETRLNGEPLQYEFGPYHPDGSPMATYKLVTS